MVSFSKTTTRQRLDDLRDLGVGLLAYGALIAIYLAMAAAVFG